VDGYDYDYRILNYNQCYLYVYISCDHNEYDDWNFDIEYLHINLPSNYNLYREEDDVNQHLHVHLSRNRHWYDDWNFDIEYLHINLPSNRH